MIILTIKHIYPIILNIMKFEFYFALKNNKKIRGLLLKDEEKEFSWSEMQNKAGVNL